ncbi:MAG: fibronectin type III domain-containing protein, partial [Candidatus Kapaibacteriota bacterium]
MKKGIIICLTIFLNTIFYSDLYAQYTTKWDLRYLDTRIYQVPYRIYEDGSIFNLELGQFFGEIPFDAIDDENIVFIDKSAIFRVDSLMSLNDVYQDFYSGKYRLKIIKSTDGGINWYNIYPDLYKNYSNQAITSIQFLSKNWIFFSGRSILHKNLNDLNDDIEEFSSITYSSDGGKNWTHCRIDTLFDGEYKNTQNVTNIKMIDSLNGFAIINSTRNFKLVSTDNCWKNYEIQYFTKYDPLKIERATSIDIYKTNTIDSTVVAITDTRGYILISNNKGKTFRSIKISNILPKQVRILNEKEFLILCIDSTIQDIKGIPQKGKYKVIKYNVFYDKYENVYSNDAGEITQDIYKYDEKNISVFSGQKLLMTKDGGVNWEEQDLSPSYIKYTNQKKVFALSPAYGRVPNLLENNISQGNIALYRTDGNSTLKKPKIYINNILVSNSPNITIDSTFCEIRWNSIIGANYYFLKIYGEHKKYFQGSINIPYYLTNKQDNIWKKDEVIQILTKDTSYLFQNIKRNMIYSIEIYSINSVDTLKSFPSIALFKSDTTNLVKPDIFNPRNNSSINTDNILIEWNPIEGATGYNVQVGQDGMFSNKVYEINLKVKNYKNTSYLLSNLEPNKIYYIAISAMNDDDISDWSMINFSTESVLSLTDKTFNKIAVWPNPAVTFIRINLQQEGQVAITAVDLLGR